MKKIVYFLSCISLLFTSTACDEDLLSLKDENKGAYVATEKSPISTTLSNDENFSEWIHVLNYSDNYSVLNTLYEGASMVKYTHFAPNNEAMQQFYASKGINGIEELGKAYASALVRTMTYRGDSLKLTEKFTPSVNVFTLNSAANEKLSLEVDIEQPGFLMVNVSGSESVHVERNYITCTNGFIYETSGVLSPLVETLYDRIVANGKSTIMIEALNATGYQKDLSIVADTTYTLGKRTITPRAYTFMNVEDETFAKVGIHNLAELKTALVNRTSDASVGQDSLLKQYVEYHLFQGSYSRKDLLETNGSDTVRIWETMAKNQILLLSKAIVSIEQKDSVTNDTTFISYLNTEDIEGQAITIEGANVMAKNGYLHALSGWLPVYEPKPTTVVWDLTDYAEVRNEALRLEKPFQPTASSTNESVVGVKDLSCYTVEVGPDGVGSNEYPALAYVTCKSNLENCLHHDRLVINVGYMGNVSMKTPTLAKGKYRVSIDVAYLTTQSDIKSQKNCKGGIMRLSVDGENEIHTTPYTSITSSKPGVYTAELYDEIEFTETNSHTFKFLILDPAASSSSKFCLQFDAITFTPIE